MYMLYRLLRSDPKTHSGNSSELVICIEPEPLQSKMEPLPTNFLLHIQHFLSPAPSSRFVLQHERNDSYLQFPFYRKFFRADHDINFMFVVLQSSTALHKVDYCNAISTLKLRNFHYNMSVLKLNHMQSLYNQASPQ